MKVALLFMPCSVKDSCRHADFSRNRTWMKISDIGTPHENTAIRTEDRKELSTNGVAMTTISVGQNTSVSFRFLFFFSKNLQNEKEYKLAHWLAS